MTTSASPESTSSTWRASAPAVRQAIAFIKRKGVVTAEELVAWDAAHGRRLFDWNDPRAAEEWRKQQARAFMNRFRGMFDGMRVRAFIHVREDAEAKIEQSGYVTVESIAAHTGMREQVIADITGRMARMASELKMWHLSAAEQRKLFHLLADAINGAESQKRRVA